MCYPQFNCPKYIPINDAKVLHFISKHSNIIALLDNWEPNMKNDKTITIRFSNEVIEKLKELADKRGYGESYSDMIRRACFDFIKNNKES